MTLTRDITGSITGRPEGRPTEAVGTEQQPQPGDCGLKERLAVLERRYNATAGWGAANDGPNTIETEIAAIREHLRRHHPELDSLGRPVSKVLRFTAQRRRGRGVSPEMSESGHLKEPK